MCWNLRRFQGLQRYMRPGVKYVQLAERMTGVDILCSLCVPTHSHEAMKKTTCFCLLP